YGVFFFQAEDGIRDWSVTGVQTCALPISVQSLGYPTRELLQLTDHQPQLRVPVLLFGPLLVLLLQLRQPLPRCLDPRLELRPVQIGRASCRERGSVWEVARSLYGDEVWGA